MDTSEAAMNLLSLPNELLCHIFSYLSFSDLKDVRLTCNRFSDVIMESPDFKNRLKISVNAKNLSEIAECIQRNEFRLSLSNVEFKNVNDYPQVTYVVNTIANDVHQLSLHEATIYGALASVAMPNLWALNVYHYYESTEKFLNWNLTSYGNLKSLSIYDRDDSELSLKHHILKQVIAMKTVKLQSLDVNCTDETLVISILKLNAKSLIELKIHFWSPPTRQHQKSWTEVFENMSSLKILHIHGSEVSAAWILTSLTALPETVRLNDIAITGPFAKDDEVLSFIARKYQDCLESADFCYSRRLTDYGFEELRQNARKLKRLNISGSNIRFDSFVFQQNVPLQELNLSRSMDLSEDSICRMSENLPDLVVLKLNFVKITNKNLAYIFRYQTRLQTLTIHDCYKITGRGLMGFGEKNWPSPMPITRLKDLKSLELLDAKNITKRCVREGMKFNQLRHLQFPLSNKITNDDIACLTKNCPAIEELWLDGSYQLTVDGLFTVANNLKHLRYFLITSCFIPEEELTNFFKMNPRIKNEFINDKSFAPNKLNF